MYVEFSVLSVAFHPSVRPCSGETTVKPTVASLLRQTVNCLSEMVVCQADRTDRNAIEAS